MRLTITREAFVAKLPSEMSDHHVDVLERWADESCAAHRILKTPRYVALYCLRDRPRTSQAWQRHLRQALIKLGVPTPKPGTRWLELIETSQFQDVEQEHAATSIRATVGASGKPQGGFYGTPFRSSDCGAAQRADNFLSQTAEDGDKVFSFLPQSHAAVCHSAMPQGRAPFQSLGSGVKSRLQVVKLD